MDDVITALHRAEKYDREPWEDNIYRRAIEEIERLRSIAEYATHKENCWNHFTVDGRCSCGLTKLQDIKDNE